MQNHQKKRVLGDLFMLEARAAARTGLDGQLLRRVEEALLQSSIQVLEVPRWRRGLEIQLIPPVVSIALCVLLPPVDPV